MSASATQLVWPLLAAPPREDCEDIGEPAHCWLCGRAWRRGQRVDRWNGASFTGQNRVRCPTSEWVCEPCVHICSRIAPVPGRPPKPGKKLGGNFRNYSHLFDAGDYSNHSKGEKPAILAWLRAPKRGPWFAAIADSGQKHTLPWAPANPPGTKRGTVLFDETLVELPDAGGWRIVDAMVALLTAGATKEEMARGDYGPRAWQLCGTDLARFEAEWGEPSRGGAWFSLALWLAQRDEEAVAERLAAEKAAKAAKKERRGGKTRRGATRKAPNADGGAPAGASGAVSAKRRKPAQALGSAARSASVVRAADEEPGRVGDADDAAPPTTRAQQLGLPGLG